MKDILNKWLRSRNYKWLIKHHEVRTKELHDFLNYAELDGFPETKKFVEGQILDHAKEVKRLLTELELIK